MWGRGAKNVDLLECLNLYDYQFKAIRYNYRSIYMNPMVTTNQKPTIRGFPGGAVVKNLPVNAGDTGSSPGLGRSHMPWSN